MSTCRAASGRGLSPCLSCSAAMNASTGFRTHAGAVFGTTGRLTSSNGRHAYSLWCFKKATSVFLARSISAPVGVSFASPGKCPLRISTRFDTPSLSLSSSAMAFSRDGMSVFLPALFSSAFTLASRAPKALCGFSDSLCLTPGSSGKWQVRQSLSFLARNAPKYSASACLWAGRATAAAGRPRTAAHARQGKTQLRRRRSEVFMAGLNRAARRCDESLAELTGVRNGILGLADLSGGSIQRGCSVVAHNPPIYRQRVGGAALPGERSRPSDSAAAQRVTPVVVADGARHGVAPAGFVVRIDEVGVPAADFGDGVGRRGQHGAAAGQHLHRRQTETFVEGREHQSAGAVVERGQVGVRGVAEMNHAAMP